MPNQHKVAAGDTCRAGAISPVNMAGEGAEALHEPRPQLSICPSVHLSVSYYIFILSPPTGTVARYCSFHPCMSWRSTA